MRFLLHVSDLHMGGDPKNSPPPLEEVASFTDGFINEIKTVTKAGSLSGIVFGGDYVDQGWFASAPNAVSIMRRMATGLNVSDDSLAMCIGNHDLDLDAQGKVFKSSSGNLDLSRKAMYEPFKKRLWRPMVGATRKWQQVCCFDFPDRISVLCIDTCQEITHSTRGRSSLPDNATQNILAAIGEQSSVEPRSYVLAMHHPPEPVPETSYMGIPGWMGLSKMVAPKIRGVLYGNQHEQVTREINDSDGASLCVGCRTFGKFRATANRGATVLGFDDRGKISRVVDVAFVADRTDHPWLHGHWSIYEALRKRGRPRTDTFSGPSIRGKRKGKTSKLGTTTQAYEVYDEDLSRMIQGWVRDEELLIQGRFAVHRDRLSVTWIDVERLLTDPTKVTEVAVNGAKWLKSRPNIALEKTILIGVDTNGAILATRIAGIVGMSCTYLISEEREWFHAAYEKHFTVPATVNKIILVTDVVSSRATIDRVANRVRSQCKGQPVSIEVLSVFVARRDQSSATTVPTTCFCDAFAVDVVNNSESIDMLPLDLDLRASV